MNEFLPSVLISDSEKNNIPFAILKNLKQSEVGRLRGKRERETEELPERMGKKKWAAAAEGSAESSPIGMLDDGCLMHIFSFLSPIPDRYNTALVCHRWRFLACHPRLWLRVEKPLKTAFEPGVFPTLEAAISAARPGDTILIAAGSTHIASSIQIKKTLCLIGAGINPDDTVLTCPRGADSALEFLSTCKVANLTIRAELGCCLLHRGGRLTIEGCVLQCEDNPLDYLSCQIMCAGVNPVKGQLHGVTVARTRIEGGAKAVRTSGALALQHVRAIYTRASVFFWFEVGEK